MPESTALERLVVAVAQDFGVGAEGAGVLLELVEAPVECWTCRGDGWVAETTADPLPSGEPGEPYQIQATCPDCGGAGSLPPAGPRA